jgi:aspartate kinase
LLLIVELKPIAPALDSDFDGLEELLRGVVAVGELTPRTTDTIAGFGERVSSRIAAATAPGATR